MRAQGLYERVREGENVHLFHSHTHTHTHKHTHTLSLLQLVAHILKTSILSPVKAGNNHGRVCQVHSVHP